MGTVLVDDDEPVVRDVVVRYLEAGGPLGRCDGGAAPATRGARVQLVTVTPRRAAPARVE
jgi:hypothetical protein